MSNLEAAILKYSHTSTKCFIVGLSLGGVTALCLLRNRPEFMGERVAKIFVSSPRLTIPRYSSLIIVIAVPLIRFYLFLNSIGWIRQKLESWTGIKISEELANDMLKWARFTRILEASKNLPNPENVVDNIKIKVDLELMLCMVPKDSLERILSVQEVMEEKVTRCEAVIALNQIHLYAPFC